jgi:hypothetical protein
VCHGGISKEQKPSSGIAWTRLHVTALAT